MFVEHNDPVELAKEIFWLAWNACCGTFGMGCLRDNPLATREDVWNNIINSGDYCFNSNSPDEPYADYVFGRMMKFRLIIKKDGIEIEDFKPNLAHQPWCLTYSTVKKLVNAACKSLDSGVNHVH